MSFKSRRSKNKLFETVHPCLIIFKRSYIGNVNGVMNAVIMEGKPIGNKCKYKVKEFYNTTSSSLLSDLLSILRGY